MYLSSNDQELRRKRTGIHRAVADGDLALVQQFIEAGTDLEQKDFDYATPLGLAVSSRNQEMIKILLKCGAFPSTQVLDIVTEDEEFCGIDILSLLIEAGMDINDDGLEEGETAIMRASQYGSLEVVQKLIESGVDVNAVSRKGGFALLKAGHARHQEIFEYLIPLTSLELRAKAAQELPNRLARLLVL
jgi:uncharacterized protein